MPASSLSSARAVWYKRPWFLATAAIGVIVGASILVDLPSSVSTSADVASQTASIKEISQDLSGCSYAVKESFAILHELSNGSLTTDDRKYAPKLLADDQTACSFTSSSIFDLTNNIQVQDTAAGKHIDAMLSAATIWATSDALAAVEDIQVLYSTPNDATRLRDLHKQELALATDRQLVMSDVYAADKILHTTLAPPALPVLQAG